MGAIGANRHQLSNEDKKNSLPSKTRTITVLVFLPLGITNYPQLTRKQLGFNSLDIDGETSRNQIWLQFGVGF